MSRAAMSCVERAKRELLPLELACYHALREMPGGTAGFAAQYGRNPSTMQHKLSPTQRTHNLTPVEVEEITAYTRDPRIVDSMIAAFGNACWVDLQPLLERQQREHRGEVEALAEVLTSAGEALRKQSGLLERLGHHLSDGVLDHGEAAECKQLIQRVYGALLLLERTLDHHVEGGPAHG